MEKDYLLHKWLNNEATSEEVEQLREDPEYVSYIQIAIASSGFEAPPKWMLKQTLKLFQIK